VLNAANEVAVDAFLGGRLNFTGIARVIEDVLDRQPVVAVRALDDVLEADREARALARSALRGVTG
jgi:1-deoxy-D-xylulose-5-phosphate reductoisomerase